MPLLSANDHVALHGFNKQHSNNVSLLQHAADQAWIEHRTDWNEREERHILPEIARALDALHNVAVMFGKETASKLSALMPQLMTEYLNTKEAV
ncbi:hypothetical protein [Kozakia baliensis]|uniref:hypothetical protein n=1 Tax=Kozakia baliensis TaxID=153496 RepID=UPI0004964891|nr:hypothetical protein [Kozakia baliensis]